MDFDISYIIIWEEWGIDIISSCMQVEGMASTKVNIKV